ncbi:MAG: hypothetical protein ACLFPO_10470 [Spirochaetaceae bacterium]
MRHKERRRHTRIEAEELPAELQTVTVDFGDGRKVEARTIDASPHDMALLVPIAAGDIQSFDVALEDGSGSFHITEELVYTKPVDAETSRVSIQFSSDADLSAYWKLLDRNGGR